MSGSFCVAMPCWIRVGEGADPVDQDASLSAAVGRGLMLPFPSHAAVMASSMPAHTFAVISRTYFFPEARVKYKLTRVVLSHTRSKVSVSATSRSMYSEHDPSFSTHHRKAEYVEMSHVSIAESLTTRLLLRNSSRVVKLSAIET
jgi:hypothetical protein